MDLIKINWGFVRSFQTAFNNDVEKFQVNPKCRSFRLRNTGDDTVFILIDNIIEPLESGDNITYGGYNESFRSDVLSFEFEGVGLNPKVIIIQDVQQKDPIYTKDKGEIKNC